jgi:hypothetical protein
MNALLFHLLYAHAWQREHVDSSTQRRLARATPSPAAPRRTTR